MENIPFKVSFNDINEFEGFEERFYDINRNFGDLVGMGVGYIEFCPNSIPPDYENELLPWLWLIHPELKEDIIKAANQTLKQLIYDYEKNKDY